MIQAMLYLPAYTRIITLARIYQFCRASFVLCSDSRSRLTLGSQIGTDATPFLSRLLYISRRAEWDGHDCQTSESEKELSPG